MTAEQLENLPKRVRDEVSEFIEENPRKQLDLSSMTETEFFEHWLEWNGIIGWTARIIEVVEGLGWKDGKKR